MKKTIAILVITWLPALVHAQSNGVSKRSVRHAFSELNNKAVPGSPILGQPILVQGSTAPVKGEGAGWADPAWFDWNKDGKKDLLIGEFYSGMETKAGIKGSFIRVYLNIGTKAEPKFTDQFEYAKDKTGKNLTVDAFCCIGFTPRFYDLNGDGHIDIITGSYAGHVTCYYGSKDGFESPVNLSQKGFPIVGGAKAGASINDNTGTDYWSYSSADFVDVDGDGLLDLITGGAALRVSRNIGTKAKPEFDGREMLLDVNGKSLKISEKLVNEFHVGVYSAVPLITDWDQDGVPDMLVTSDYTNSKQPAVSFFRGVRQNKILRFEAPISLFEAADGSKQFPGAWLRTWVADWNEDGINDLIIGTSIVTVGNGETDPLLSWEWEKDTDIKKSSYKYLPAIFAESVKKYASNNATFAIKNGIIVENEKDAYIERMKTMAHQGHVYILLGKGTHKKK